MNKIISYLIVVVLSIAFIVVGHNEVKITYPESEYDEMLVYKARVESIRNIVDNSYDIGGLGSIKSSEIEFTAQITGRGSLNGLTVTGYQVIDEILAVNPKNIAVGDNILIAYYDSGNNLGERWNFSDYTRSDGLIGLGVGFLVCVLIFGGIKGFNTIITLGFTCLAIVFVYVPSIINGYDVYTSSMIISAYIIFMTLLLVNGFSKKTLCAIIGNIGGLAVAGGLTLFMESSLNLTGVTDDNSFYLMLITEPSVIDLKGVIFGAILIGALGATMDVAMTIASALHELAENIDNPNFKTMIKSGFNIGRDAMSTMTNTLVLAYIGSSLSTVILIMSGSQDLMTIFNRELIVVEVVQALVGSLGILFAIPATTLLSALVYTPPQNLNFERAMSKVVGNEMLDRMKERNAELENHFDDEEDDYE